MTETPANEQSEPAASSAIPIKSTDNPEAPMTRAERIFVRINVVQTILAVAGVFTGAVALYAALNESAAVRRQAEAAVWPIVQLSTTDFMTADDAEFKISMKNTGVGPGRMETMRVLIDGAPARDWLHATELAFGDAAAASFSKSSVDKRVIGAGETLDLFTITDRDIVAAMIEKAASGAAQIDYCYCSIFDACWLFESGTGETTRVAACPDFGAQQFQE